MTEAEIWAYHTKIEERCRKTSTDKPGPSLHMSRGPIPEEMILLATAPQECPENSDSTWAMATLRGTFFHEVSKKIEATKAEALEKVQHPMFMKVGNHPLCPEDPTDLLIRSKLPITHSCNKTPLVLHRYLTSPDPNAMDSRFTKSIEEHSHRSREDYPVVNPLQFEQIFFTRRLLDTTALLHHAILTSNIDMQEVLYDMLRRYIRSLEDLTHVECRIRDDILGI